MTRPASRHVAIWIDPRQAILLAFEAEPLDRSALHGLGEGWSQDRVDAHQYPSTQRYYGAVLSHLERLDEILILGPGQAKLELRHQIEQQGGLKGKVVGLHDASRLAKVELVFPTGEVWHSGRAGATHVESPIRSRSRSFPGSQGHYDDPRIHPVAKASAIRTDGEEEAPGLDHSEDVAG